MLPSSGFSGDGEVLNAATELSEINNLPFQVHSSPLHPPLMKKQGPLRLGDSKIQADRHAERERGRDKEEINIGRGDEGCVHRCC